MIDTAAEPQIMTPPDDPGRIFGVLDIRHDPRDVARAREWITRRINETITRLGTEAVDNVELCGSEVITNAVLHSRRGLPHDKITVVLIYTAWSIRVEVIDTGNSFGRRPHVREVDPLSDTCGRGLGIVEALSAEWGDYSDTTGRTVWFEVRYR